MHLKSKINYCGYQMHLQIVKMAKNYRRTHYNAHIFPNKVKKKRDLF